MKLKIAGFKDKIRNFFEKLFVRAVPVTNIPAPLQMFIMAFVMYILSVLPILIIHKGLFFLYGDYNVQQVPFYVIAHRAVRSGRFLWNFGLDLGGSLIGDMSFYLMGSPFFWLTVPFPEKIVPYMMPYLMALKYACSATFAYLYIRRYIFKKSDAPYRLENSLRNDEYLKNELSSRIGGFLYAFAGFNACNIVFNHFTDAVCFFPLLVLSFEELMRIDLDDEYKGKSLIFRGFDKWLFFALTVCLIAVINYFFFFGMIVFLLIYAVLRYVNSKNLPHIFFMLLRASSAGIIGVMLGAFYLSMAVGGVSGNSRLSNILTGYTLLVYPDAKMYFDILKSMVMTPDIIGRGTLFFTDTVKNSSLAFYLPMFGIAGMAAYFAMMKGKKSWQRRILIASLIIAVIPAFNAMFSLLNFQYYARWFFMPILFCSLATSLAIRNSKPRDLKFGVLIQALCFAFMLLVYFLPSKNSEGKIVMFNMSENREFFIADSIVTAIFTFLLICSVFLAAKKINRLRLLYLFTIAASIIFTMNVALKGKSLISDYGMDMWKKQMLDTKPGLPVGESFYRIETDDSSTNYDMVWGYPGIHCFLSTVPSQIFDFYKGTSDISRGVESQMPLSRDGIRALLSAKYYVWNSDIDKEGDFGKGEGIYGYDEIAFEGNGLTVFENKNYIPQGCTFDYYIKESSFDASNKTGNDRVLVKAIILSDEDAQKYGHLMEELDDGEIADIIDDEVFDELCEDRKMTACSSFIETKSGFKAVTSELKKESLVFFSVPNVEDFNVRVDGRAVDTINAYYGLMAVNVPAGVHEIEAKYFPKNLVPSACASSAAFLITCIYGGLCFRKRSKADRDLDGGTFQDKGSEDL